MRFVLVLLALLAAALAGAVVMLPRLMDPAALRERVVAEIQTATGVPLVVGGDAELQLLPRPMLSIGRVRLGDPAITDAGGFVEADRLDLDLRPLALLGRRSAVETARIVRPVLRLRGDAGGIVGGLAAALARRSGPARLLVLDGRVELMRDGRPTEAIKHLELDLRRAATGGLEMDGIGRWREQPLALVARSGALGAGPMPLDLRLSLGPQERAGTLSLRGTLSASTATPELDLEVRLEAPETAILAEAALALMASSEPVAHLRLGPLSLQGRLGLAAGRWRLAPASLAFADGELAGDVTLDPVGGGIDVELEGNRLRLSDELLGLLGRLGVEPSLVGGLAGTIQLRLDALDVRGSQLRDLRLLAGLETGGRARIERASARLPGDGELVLEGVVASLERPLDWRGRGSLATEDLRALLRWLGLTPPGVAPDRLRSLAARGDLAWAQGVVTLRELDLRLDSTRATGSLALALGPRPQVAGSLALDRIGLDGYLPQAPPAHLASTLAELLGRIDAAVDLTADVLTWQAARAERVRLVGNVTDGRLMLKELSVDDLADASASLVGGGDLRTGEIELAVEAQVERPSRLLRLLGLEPPLLVGRIAPVRLSGIVRRRGQLELEISAAAPGLGGDIELRMGDGLAGPPSRLRLALQAPTLEPLLRQLGLTGQPAPSLSGAASLEMTLEPRDAARSDVTAELRLGSSRASAELRLDRSGARPLVAGRVSVPSFDPALLGPAYELGEVTLGAPPGPPSRWPGAWPSRPLLWGWLFATDLDLRIGGEAVGGPDAAHLGLRDGALRLALASLPLAGGRLAGAVTLDGGAGVPALSVEGRLVAVDAAEILPLIGLRDNLRGRLDLEASLRAAGASPAALVRSLAGEARLRLRDGRIEGVRAPWEEAGVGARSLDLVELAGPLAIERGTAVSGGEGLSLVLPDAATRVDLRLDLLAWVLEATIDGRSPGDPSLRLIGPPGRVRALPPGASAATAEPGPP